MPTNACTKLATLVDLTTEVRNLPVVVATDLFNERRWPTFAALSWPQY